MIESSAEFIQALKSSARRLDAYFVFNEKQYHPLSFSIDSNNYSSESDTFIGTFIARSGKMKVDPADGLDLENQWVELYQGLMVGDSYEYKKLGSFLCYDKDSKNEYSIIDKKAVFNELAEDWNYHTEATPSKLISWVCYKTGVDYVTTTGFPNADLNIPDAQVISDTPTYADIIVAIAQATCTFARITPDDKLELAWFSEADFTIESENLSGTWPEVSQDYGPINSLVLAREPLNDNVYIQDEESIATYGLTELKIADNPILDNDRYTSREEIFARINGFRYTPIKCKSQGFFILQPGDIIRVQLKDMSYASMYVMNHTIKYSGSSSSSFETPALTKAQIQYQTAETVKQALKRTEAIVDKQNQQIQLVVEEQTQKLDDASNDITEAYTSLINQTSEQLSLMIEQLTETTSDIDATIASISNELEITSEMAQFVKTTTEQLQSVVDGKVDTTTIQEWARFDGASLELGVSDSPFKAVLTNTELAFYQGSNKVAWLSNNELHVLTAVITTSIGCGNFRFVDEGDWGFSLI